MIIFIGRRNPGLFLPSISVLLLFVPAARAVGLALAARVELAAAGGGSGS